jgi:hypothetical protein
VKPGDLVRGLGAAVKECCLAFPQDEEDWDADSIARGLHVRPHPDHCLLDLVEDGHGGGRVTLIIDKCETGFAGHWTTQGAVEYATERLRELGVDDVAIQDFDSFAITEP